MLPTLLIAGLLQAATFVPFEGPDSDAGVTALGFDPSGDTLLIAHRHSRSLTRYDVPAGAVTAGLDLGPDMFDCFASWSIEWIPGTSDALVLDPVRRLLFKVDTLTMTVLGEALLTVENGSGLAVTSDGASCAIVEGAEGARQLSIVNVASMTETHVVDIGAATYPARTTAWVTADDLRVVVAGSGSNPSQSDSFAAYSIATGALEVTAALPSSIERLDFIQQSPDRSTWLLNGHDAVTGQPAYYRVSGPDLTLQNEVRLSGFPSALASYHLDATGDRAWGLFLGTVFAFPIDQAVVTPSTAGTVQFQGPYATNLHVSGERTRVLIGDRRGRLAVFDAGGAMLGSDLASVLPLEPASISTCSGAPLFATHRHLVYDQVRILDGRGSATVLDERVFNSSPNASFEGPFAIEALPGGREVVVRAHSTAELGVFDGQTGVMRGSVAIEDGSQDIDIRSDGQVLVGHEDGTLLALDPIALVETARLQLDGVIEQVAAEPSGTRAWVRIGGSPSRPRGASLVLLETAGAQAGEIGRVDLLAPARFPLVANGPSGGIYYGPCGDYPIGNDFDDETASVVFDFPRGLAYAVSPVSQTIETLDLATLSRTGSYSYGPLDPFYTNNPVLTLAPGGEHLIVRTSTGGFLLRPTPQGFSQVASTECFSGPTYSTVQGFSKSGAVAFMGRNCTPLQQLLAVDVATGQTLDTVSGLSYFDLQVQDEQLMLLGSDGTYLIRFDGTSFSTPERILDQAGSFAFDAPGGLLAVAVDGFSTSGLWIADLFDGRLQVACDGGTPNATGVQATLSAGGSPFAGSDLVLTVSGLEPLGMLGVLGVSDALTQPMPGASGVGTFCLGGLFQRALGSLRSADAAGTREHVVATSALATSLGSITMNSGTTWVFQEWHRDTTATGLGTSNASTALAVTFR